jgi:tRNA nucleotidyltransferase (CCA-adding enzyme)
VVNPEDGAVIGIVTRTDLLKTMGDTAPSPGYTNLGNKLEAALPAARLALLKEIAAKGHDQHMAVYVVGGFVRDLLMNRPSPDFDVVVEGDAIALASTLAECYGGKLVSHGRFGTAKWTICEVRASLAKSLSPVGLDPADLPESLDLISARTEFYDYPTALPTVERSSIKLDLHRRDFTINTMALRLDGRHYGELYDYWGGLRDLRGGLVRVLHSLSFVDDPTRMMRAVRFEQRFGFQIEKRTLQLIDEARPLVRQVSGDRLRHEFILMLSEEHTLEMLARLQDLQLLSAIYPSLNWQPGYAKVFNLALSAPIDPIWNLPEKIGSLPLRQALALLTWLAHFPHEDAEAITQRLRLPREIRAGIEEAISLREELPAILNSPPSVITSRLDQVQPAALFVLDLFETPGALREVIYNYLKIWRNIWPVTNGDTLRQMGIPPGPRYRLILSRLRNAWLDGEIASVTEENHLLQELLRNLPDND